ncbi:MAG: 3-dehydroquinate synthase [Christensenellaceae bacterium]|nr:3-dehydroquinate synthase [Christensenellaceae bacterium]
MKLVHVEAQNGNYEIRIENGLLAQAGQFVSELGFGRALVVTDENVDALYGKAMMDSLRSAGIAAEKTVLPAGEQTKCKEQLFAIYDALSGFGISRADALIAFGGGVIGDLAGFAAATYMRGIGFVQVPTTLLAQVDSSVGGKVAIDLPYAKNIIGAFYQPNGVLIDTALLASLDKRQLAAGMAEVIKYAAIADASLEQPIMARDLEEIVCRSCSIKADYVRRDPFDKGCRMELNFGHTLGHCLEVQSEFSMLHGEGVATGMAIMAALGEKLGLTEKGTYAAITRMLDAFDLPRDWSHMDKQIVDKTVRRDKKTVAGGIRVIFIEKMGKAFARKMPPEQLMAALEEL